MLPLPSRPRSQSRRLTPLLRALRPPQKLWVYRRPFHRTYPLRLPRLCLLLLHRLPQRSCPSHFRALFLLLARRRSLLTPRCLSHRISPLQCRRCCQRRSPRPCRRHFQHCHPRLLRPTRLLRYRRRTRLGCRRRNQRELPRCARPRRRRSRPARCRFRGPLKLRRRRRLCRLRSAQRGSRPSPRLLGRQRLRLLCRLTCRARSRRRSLPQRPHRFLQAFPRRSRPRIRAGARLRRRATLQPQDRRRARA